MTRYNINISVSIDSDLSESDLKNELVIALYNSNTENFQADGINDNLRVIDYKKIEIEEK